MSRPNGKRESVKIPSAPKSKRIRLVENKSTIPPENLFTMAPLHTVRKDDVMMPRLSGDLLSLQLRRIIQSAKSRKVWVDLKNNLFMNLVTREAITISLFIINLRLCPEFLFVKQNLIVFKAFLLVFVSFDTFEYDLTLPAVLSRTRIFDPCMLLWLDTTEVRHEIWQVDSLDKYPYPLLRPLPTKILIGWLPGCL